MKEVWVLEWESDPDDPYGCSKLIGIFSSEQKLKQSIPHQLDWRTPFKDYRIQIANHSLTDSNRTGEFTAYPVVLNQYDEEYIR
jgi:hypothetical protein